MIPHPLRVLGVARLFAGALFVADGVSTLLRARVLVPQVVRLVRSGPNGSDASIRALLILITAVIFLGIGVRLLRRSLGWVRPFSLPAEGPPPIERDEVILALRQHRLNTLAERSSRFPWPFRIWLTPELAGTPHWRREQLRRGFRAVVTACGVVMLLALAYLVGSLITDHDLFGPFPATFALLFPAIAAAWTWAAYLLIAQERPRVETFEFALPEHEFATPIPSEGRIFETPPRRLSTEPFRPAVTLGIVGVLAQCFLLSWWSLVQESHPQLVTALLRDVGFLGGGVFFFLLGRRMVEAAASILLRIQYDSTLVLVEPTDRGLIAVAAEIRSETRGGSGTRHILAAVAGAHARDTAPALVRQHSSEQWMPRAPADRGA